MQLLDVIIELLETGKKLFHLDSCNLDVSSLGTKRESIEEIINVINRLLGYKRSNDIYAYYEGKINKKNVILRLVVHKPDELRNSPSSCIRKRDAVSSNSGDVIPLRKKSSRKEAYNKYICIEALQKASEFLGTDFNKKAYEKFARSREDMPCSATIIRYLGGERTAWRLILSEARIDSLVLREAK